MDLVKLARETVFLCDDGYYDTPTGSHIFLGGQVREAVAGTQFFSAGATDKLSIPRRCLAPAIEVTTETTSEAGRRLAYQGQDVTILNFASAKHPGGGFLSGARAQEEDLCRCSALFHCLRDQREYYEENRVSGTPLYTDGLIVSPGVPFFRDKELRLVGDPWRLSVVTCPAPNAGESSASYDKIRRVLTQRARAVLIAMARNSGTAILGAWGCGVFGNDPEMVAHVFRSWLDDPSFSQSFARVVFAVPDQASQNHQAFVKAFK